MLKTIRTKLKFQSNYSSIDLDSIEVDTALTYDLFIKKDDDYIIIVEAGTVINSKIYTLLQSQAPIFVSKNDLKKRDFNSNNLEEKILNNKDNPEYCIKLLYEATDHLWNDFFDSEDDMFHINCVESIANCIILLVKHNKYFLKENISSLKNDNILAQHSLHVSIYAISLAHTLKLNDSQLKEIGIAGLINDIGYKKIGEEILAKDSDLTDSEKEKIQQHPRYSVEFAKHNKVHNPFILNSILHHHENYDGTGYPDKLKAKDININTSILSICDVFNALTSNRAYREHMSSFEALTYMMKDISMQNKFNPSQIKIFIKLLVDK